MPHYLTIPLSSGGAVRVQPLSQGCGLTVEPDHAPQSPKGSTAFLTLTEALAVIRALAEVRP